MKNRYFESEVERMKFKKLKVTAPQGKEKKSKSDKVKDTKEKKGLFQKLRKMKRRTVVIMIVCIVGIVVAVVAAVLYFGSFKGNQKQDFPFGNKQGGANSYGGNQFAVSGDIVTASGVTSVGVTEEIFEVENLTTALEIEELYISSEEDITEGTKVLKLSEDSIAEARAELEQTLKDADLAYRAGAIEYEQSKITAEYDRDSTILSGEQAKAVYEETLSGLTISVERAQEELDQAKEDIAEYQSYVNNESYKSYFKVDEYQAIYDETLEALMDKMEEWGVSWPQVTGQGGASSMGNGSAGGEMPANTVSGGDAEQNVSPTSDQIQVLASLYDVLELQRKDLDQAESDYENALANAAFELQTLELKLPDLENALTEARKNYENQLLQAEITYETSLLNAQSAESDYETAIEQAETTYESLKKDWEDAKENLELYENSVGDGYFYASGNGTILRTMVRAGQNLSSEGTIFMYSNPEEMTVTVSVDQADISRVALDDAVYIQSSEFGGFEGSVIEINPVSNSDSRTNVTYTVTVKFRGETEGNSSGIGANESVTVVFGMDTETIQSMISMSQGNVSGKEQQENEGVNVPGDMPQDGQLPEGFTPGELPEGGQLPEGFTPGEMPEGFTPGELPEGNQRPENGATGNGTRPNWQGGTGK